MGVDRWMRLSSAMGVTRLCGAKRTLSHETSSLAPSLMRQKGRMARLRRLINDRFLAHMVRFTRWLVRLEARGRYELISHLKNRAKINVSFFGVRDE